MKQLMIYKGANAGETAALDPSDALYEIALAASTAQATPVPLGSRFAIFSATGDFYARYDGAAATIPSSATWTSGNVELNPGVRKVTALTAESSTVISVIAPTDCVITIAFYS
jgi:hypothetical protein